MHLGLSPSRSRYRDELYGPWFTAFQVCGVTIHHATPKLDGGDVIGQRRPRVERGDASHDLGCKTIIAGASLLADLLSRSELPSGQPQAGGGVLCLRRDFTPEALAAMQMNLRNGMLSRYIEDKRRRDERYPIIDHI